jgi:hypothetical protein
LIKTEGVLNIWRQAVANMANTRDMPTTLRVITSLGMLGCVVGLVAMATMSVIWGAGNQTTPFTYMWWSGVWVSPVLWLLLIFVGCLGVAARRPSFRWILVFSPFLVEVLSISHVGLRLLDVASAAFWGLSSYVYLFHVPSVRSYFCGVAPAK